MKAMLLALMVVVLIACAGPVHTSGSGTVGSHGGSGSGTVTITVPAQ